MGIFQYRLKTLQGKTVRGVVTASTLDEARVLLGHKDLILISLSRLKAWQQFLYKPTLKTGDLLSLFKSLAQLCRAGLPLLDALKSLQTHSHKKSYQSIIQLIKQGSSLSQALKQSALMTNDLLLSFLKQAEINGDYPKAFDQIVEHIRWLEELKKRLKQALSYPALVLSLSIALMIFLMHFVVPQLLDLYHMSNLKTPPMTQALMTFSQAMPAVLIGLTGGLGSVLFLSAFMLLYGHHSSFLRRRFLLLILRIPVIGMGARDILLLQYTKSMQALLSTQKESILKAMTCAENSLQPYFFRTLFLQPRLSVEQGDSFSQALQNQFPLPLTIFQMLQVGEKSGTLPLALQHVTTYIESHLQESLNKFIQRLGPTMLLIVGGLLIFIISAVFLPLYSGLGGLET